MPLLLLLLLAPPVMAEDPAGPGPDAGTPAPDSGTPGPDSGTPVPDAGTPAPERPGSGLLTGGATELALGGVLWTGGYIAFGFVEFTSDNPGFAYPFDAGLMGLGVGLMGDGIGRIRGTSAWRRPGGSRAVAQRRIAMADIGTGAAVGVLGIASLAWAPLIARESRVDARYARDCGTVLLVEGALLAGAGGLRLALGDDAPATGEVALRLTPGGLSLGGTW